jgi:hypothetical protein
VAVAGAVLAIADAVLAIAGTVLAVTGAAEPPVSRPEQRLSVTA